MGSGVLTTVDLVRADLITRFANYLNSSGISDTELAYGQPSSDWTKYVAVGSTRDKVEHLERTAPRRISDSVTESYTLDIVIWHLAENQFGTDAQKAVVDSCAAIYRCLDGGLRANADEWTLGRLVTAATFVDYEPDDFWLTEGRAAQIIAGLEIDVRRL